MEWKSIHVGRLCMPLRFPSAGWILERWRLGQGPKPMPELLISDLPLLFHYAHLISELV